MQVKENISLRPYNTMGIDVGAKYFASFSGADELEELLYAHASHRPLILGGGSNILFTNNYDGIILKNEVTGIEKMREDDKHVYIRAGAGESWHGFVQHCIVNSFAGVENLSLIPGNTGASPIQNIGAYGVEMKDVFEELDAFHLHERKIYRFGAADCHFGYRESSFKRKYAGQFAILSVTYRLNKTPRFNISYGAIEQELEQMGIKDLSIAAVSQAVINIRRSRLPDPAVIGNAGSFFKNPTVPAQQFNELKAAFPLLPAFPAAHGDAKLAAGWLIEQCGWKGFRRGDAGCHARQALVLVNYGGATGKEIYDLSGEILQSVKDRFGVVLEREVNVV